MKLIDIHKELKSTFSFDIVPIRCGFYYNLYNEDTLFFTQNYNFKSYEQGKNILCGFPKSSLDHWELIFKKQSLKYAIVDQENEIVGDKKKIIRVVTRSSDGRALNKRFEKGVRVTKSEKLQEHIFALSEGFDPFSGEIFDNQSVWKHPEISKMLKLVMDQQAPELSNEKKHTKEGLSQTGSEFFNNKSREKEFFKIEELKSFTPVNKNTTFLLENIKEHRQKNEREGELLNYFVPITKEEIEVLLEKYKYIQDIEIT